MNIGAKTVQTASAFGSFPVTSQRPTSKWQIMQCGLLCGQEISTHCNNAVLHTIHVVPTQINLVNLTHLSQKNLKNCVISAHFK